MELKWLEDFLTLVDTRNFSRSAELRYTTQPAFSRRIKALEEWVGAPLFERSSHPIGLTEAGDQFRGIAEEVVRRLYQGREELRLATAGAAGTIKFAATHSLSLTFFPAWIGAIEDAGGVLNIRLDTGHAGACVQMLLKGRCHFMLSHTHPAVETGLDPRQFLSRAVGRDRLVPVTTPDADGRPADRLPGTAARPCRYLAYAETSAIGRAVTHMLRRRDGEAHLDRQFVSHLAAVLRTMAREGRGLAWVPQSQVEGDLAAGTLVRAGDPSWDLDVEIRLFRPAETLSATAEAFWTTIDSRPSTGLDPQPEHSDAVTV